MNKNFDEAEEMSKKNELSSAHGHSNQGQNRSSAPGARPGMRRPVIPTSPSREASAQRPQHNAVRRNTEPEQSRNTSAADSRDNARDTRRTPKNVAQHHKNRSHDRTVENRNPEEFDRKQDSERSRKKRSTFYPLFQNLLLVLAVALIIAGLYFLIKPILDHNQQEKSEAALRSQLEQQPTAVITVRVGDVKDDGSFHPRADLILPPGETMDPDLPEPTLPPLDENEIVDITTDGIMLIPYINLDVALGTDVTYTTLAIVPGHMPGTPQPGEVGIATYFGHNWIYKKDRHFSRLREVPVGEQIDIKRDGNYYVYRIDLNELITPDRLGEYIYQETDKSRILLVTCYRPPGNDTGSALYRTIVGAHLESVQPVS